VAHLLDFLSANQDKDDEKRDDFQKGIGDQVKRKRSEPGRVRDADDYHEWKLDYEHDGAQDYQD
jgi:hypothetical protein